ncbi:MAG: 30S ribosome-binding factor RbfA [Candidatus Omnitrophota bacterium]
MQGRRVDRVAHLIQMEIGRIIVTKMKDPRLNFVTVTHVKITPDMKNAFVFFSILGKEDAREKALAAFQKAAGFLQKEIASELKLRYTPKLEFRYDDSLERGLEIDRLLREIQSKQGPQGGTPA